MTFSFIGTGNMGGALARAAAKTLPPSEITLSNRSGPKAETLAEELGCSVSSVRNAAWAGRYIFLGVKPQMMAGLLKDLSIILRSRKDEFVLVTMAAGITMEQINEMVGGEYPVIRIMPNTPCAVGAGLILYDANEHVKEEDLQEFLHAMSGAGLLDRLDEHLIDAGSAVAGCGPAYAAMFVEALSDGGVAVGLPRDKALRYAAKMLEGTAKLMLETNVHPGPIKDAVCSPGGSTIAGVRALEEGGFRAAAMNAVIAAHKRNTELGK